MIGYDEMLAAADVRISPEERDEWWDEQGLNAESLIRFGSEVSRIRLLHMQDVERVSDEVMTMNLLAMFVAGFDLGWRLSPFGSGVDRYLPGER